MNNLFKIILLPLFLIPLSAHATLKFNPGLISFSAGSWVTLPTGEPPIYFNKAGVTMYASLNGWKIEPSVPLAWTVVGSSGRQRFFWGDGSIGIGHRLGAVVPQIGISLPLGYGQSDTWKKEAWIGTNNVKAKLGLSYGRPKGELDGMPLSIEAVLSTPITERSGYLKFGSISGVMYAKTYWRINKKLRYGIELLLLGSRSKWIWKYRTQSNQWEPVVELSGTVMPNIWGEYRLNKRWYCIAKVGFGPTLKKSNAESYIMHSSNALNVGGGLQWYP